MVVWLYGYMVVWLYGYTVVLHTPFHTQNAVYSTVYVTQPYSHIAIQPYSHLTINKMQVFISRDQRESSEFASILSSNGWEVLGQSLVHLTPLPFSDIPAADWIFFSSQNAVLFFFETLENQHLEIPKVQWAALGKATSATLQLFVEAVHFTGTGDPTISAQAFIPLCTGQTVLFPGARHSRQTIRQFMEPVTKIQSLEVYDNIPISDPPQIDARVLVFTSPLNAQAYLSKFPVQSWQKVIAIGQTTAMVLKELGLNEVLIATEPTEKALAKAVISLLG